MAQPNFAYRPPLDAARAFIVRTARRSSALLIFLCRLAMVSFIAVRQILVQSVRRLRSSRSRPTVCSTTRANLSAAPAIT